MRIILRNKIFLSAVCFSFLTYIIFFGQFLTPSNFFWGSEGKISDVQTKHVPARTYFYEKITQEH